MVRVVERTLAILDAFDAEMPALTLQNIGDRIGLSKATTHRLVNSLTQSGYLVRGPNNRYMLSLKFVRLAGIVRSTLGVRDMAHATMARVAAETCETVSLNTISGNSRLCIEVIETPAPLMHIVRPGEQIPLLYGATGKVLLTYMSKEATKAVLMASPKKDRPNYQKLIAQLAAFRKQGYALTSNERALGVTAVSVPLFDVNGTVNNCLTLSGPSIRMEPKLKPFIALMLSAGADITKRLGGTPLVAKSPAASGALRARSINAK